MNNETLLMILTVVLAIWALIWKGLTLWHSAKNNQRNGFLIIFILVGLNTLGALEMIYLFRFAKKKVTVQDLINDFKHFFNLKKASK